MAKLVKRLNAQELGYRNGEPRSAGRYIYISKYMVSSLPPVPMGSNPRLPLYVSNLDVTCDYVYYTEGTRDEYRIYLDPIDPNQDYQPGDIVIITPEDDEIIIEHLTPSSQAYAQWDAHIAERPDEFDII